MYRKVSRWSLKDGDIFNASEQTIVVTINTVGAMGRGVALGCKERYPDIYKHYKEQCRLGKVQGSSLLSYRVSSIRRILLFPTKLDWREPSPPQLIIDNLNKLRLNVDTLKITSLAVPPLGQANGWLRGEDKKRVQYETDQVLSSLNMDVTLYLTD